MGDLEPQAFVGAVVAVVLGAVRIAGAVIERRNAKRLAHAEKYTPPSAPPAQATPDAEADLEELTGRVKVLEAEVRVARTEWTLAEARARVRELEAQLNELALDHARTGAALSREREHRARLESEMETLRQRLTAAEERAREAVKEQLALRREVSASLTTGRPAPRPRSNRPPDG